MNRTDYYANHPDSWNQPGDSRSGGGPQNFGYPNEGYNQPRDYYPNPGSHQYQQPLGYPPDRGGWGNPSNQMNQPDFNNYNPRYSNYPENNYPASQNNWYPDYRGNPPYSSYQDSRGFSSQRFDPRKAAGQVVFTDPSLHRGQNFRGQTSGIEAMSSNNYYFYYVIDPIVAQKPKINLKDLPVDPEEELQKKREEWQKYQTAERLLNEYPMPQVIRSISEFVIKIGFDPLNHFQKLDTENKGKVIKKQFFSITVERWGLVRNSITSQAEVDRLAEIFDIYNTGEFYYLEFCKKVHNPEYRMDGEAAARIVDPLWKEKAYRDLAAEAFKKNIDLLELFEKLDKENLQSLTLNEFCKGIMSFTNKFNPLEIALFSDEFDFRHNEVIDYPRFCHSIQEFLNKKAVYEKVLSLLARFCSDYQINFSARLSRFDERNTKQVTREDFYSVLREIRFDTSSDDFHVFCDEIIRTKDGLLDLRFVLERLPNVREPFIIEEIYSKIKNFIMSQNQDLTETFSKFDKNGDGSLGFYEFTQALQIIGLDDLPARDIALVIQDLDTDKDGSISLAEFADKLEMSSEMLQTRVSLSFFRKIEKFLKEKGKKIQDFFRLHDFDHSSSLTKREFYRMIQTLELDLKDNDVEDLFIEIDSNRDNSISFLEFSKKYEKTIRAIQQRDAMIKAKIKKEMRNRQVREVFFPSFDPSSSMHAFYPKDLWKGLDSLRLGLLEDDFDFVIQEILDGKTCADLDDILVYLGLKLKSVVTQREPSQQIGGLKDQVLLPKWGEKWLKQIRSYSRTRKIEVKTLLESYNRDRSGKMIIPEFVLLLKDTTFALGKDEQEGLITHLKREGKIDVKTLLKLIQDLYSPAEELLELLKEFFNKTKRKISEVFFVDQHAQISKEGFFKGFQIVDPSIEHFEVVELINFINKETGGAKENSFNISASALAKLLDIKGENQENFISPRTFNRKSLNRIYDVIAESAVQQDVLFTVLFGDKFDKHGQNKVLRQDFTEVIFEVTEWKLNQDDLFLLISDLDPRNSGLINYAVFIGKLENFIILNKFVDRFFVRLKQDLVDLEIDLNKVFKDQFLLYSMSELYDELRAQKLFVDLEEFIKVFRKLDLEETGKIEVHVFISKLYSSGLKKRTNRKNTEKFRLPSQDLKNSQKKSSENILAPVNPLKKIEKVKKFKLKFKGPKQHWARDYLQLIKDYANTSKKTMRQVFQEFDLDKSGSLTKNEFRNAFEKLGVPMSLGELDMLMNELDLNRDGRVSLVEFERLAGKREMDERIEKFLEDIRETVVLKRVDLRKLFSNVDIYESNYVTYEEFLEIVGSFYNRLTRNDLLEIAKYLDIDNDKKLFYSEFIGRMMLDEIEKLNKKLVKIIRKKDLDLEGIFMNFDSRKDKCLNFRTFIMAFGSMSLPFSREEYAMVILENPIHRTSDGRYSYEDLLEILDLRRKNIKKLKITYLSTPGNQLAGENDQIYRKIYEVCERNNFDIEKAFKNVEGSNDGRVSMLGLQNGLKNVRVLLTEFEYNSIFTEFDLKKTGKIDLDGFLKRVLRDAVRINLNEMMFAATVLSKIRGYIEERQLDPVTFFKRFYLDNQGNISLYNFYSALRFIDVDPDDPITQKMISYFINPSGESIDFKVFEYAMRHITPKAPVRGK